MSQERENHMKLKEFSGTYTLLFEDDYCCVKQKIGKVGGNKIFLDLFISRG